MNEKLNKILYIVLSLLLAIFFWLYVDTEQGHTITKEFRSVPIEFIGAEDVLPSRNLMLTDGEDTTLDLTIRGPRDVVYNLRRSDVRVQVNVTGITAVGPHPLQYTYSFSDNIDSSRVTVECSRSTVTVQVSTLYSQEVPVTVSVTGEVAEGYTYMADRLLYEPSSITLSGREEDVDRVESARIVVDLTDATGTVQQEFSCELLDGQGNVVENDNIRVSDKRIEVTAPVYLIKEVPLTVKFKESPGSALDDVRWELEHQSITLAGEPASLENVEELVLGEVDLSTYLENKEIPMETRLPSGCVNLSGITGTTLYLRFRNLEIRNFTVTNISAVGLSIGQRFDPITTSVDVMVRGPADQVDLVTEEDIRIVVDLTEYTSDGTVSGLPGIVLVDGYDNVGAVGASYNISGKISSSQ